MTKGIRILITIAVLVGVLAVLVQMNKDRLIRKSVIQTVTQATGFPVEIDHMEVSLLRSRIHVHGLRLLNPEGYQQGRALVIKELLIEYNPWTLLSDPVEFKRVVLDIPQITAVRNRQGEFNLQRMSENIKKYTKGGTPSVSPQNDTPEPDGKSAPETPPADEEKEPAGQDSRGIMISSLTLRLGSMQIYDYSGGGALPAETTMKLDVDRTYTEVSDLNEVGVLLSAELLGKALPALLGLDVKDLNSRGTENIEQVGRQLESLYEENEDEFKKLGRQLEESFKDLKF